MNRMKETPSRRYPVGLVRVLLRVFSWLPLFAIRGLGSCVGRLAVALKTRAATTTLQNLEHCYPELSTDERHALARRSLRHTAASICEMPAVWTSSFQRLHKWIREVHGEALLKERLAAGPVLMILPHYGNWEFLTTYLHPITTYTCLYSPRRLHDLERLISDRRSRFGGEFLPVTQAGLRQLMYRLRDGIPLIVLPDQVPNEGRSVISEFRGRAIRTGTMPHELLRRGELSALTIVARRCRGGFSIHVQDVSANIYSADADQSVRALDQAIEAVVELDPAQYQWEYKRFRGVAEIYA